MTNSDDLMTLIDKMEQRKHEKLKFTAEEDKQLIELVGNRTHIDWNQIARRMKGRNPRQCRDRWHHYLNPNLNHGEWTIDEDSYIMSKYEEIGAHWNEIARSLTGRTGNNVRNRYLVLLRNKEKLARAIRRGKTLSKGVPTVIEVKTDESNIRENEKEESSIDLSSVFDDVDLDSMWTFSFDQGSESLFGSIF